MWRLLNYMATLLLWNNSLYEISHIQSNLDVVIWFHFLIFTIQDANQNVRSCIEEKYFHYFSHVTVKTTQTCFCLLVNEHFCKGWNLFCSMHKHDSENETFLSTSPYLPSFVMLLSSLSFVHFLYFFQMANVILLW